MLHNNGWEKQQTLSPKKSRPKIGLAGKETHQKKSCRVSKRPFQMYMAGKKQPNLNYKNNKRIVCIHRLCRLYGASHKKIY